MGPQQRQIRSPQGLLLVLCLLLLSLTVHSLQPLPAEFVPLQSKSGANLLGGAVGGNKSFLVTAVNLETQITQSFCGVATTVSVLNALERVNAPIAPLLTPYRFFTQADIFSTDCARSIITYGESEVFSPLYVGTHGMTLKQLTDLLACYAHPEVHMGSNLTLKQLRQVLKSAFENDLLVAVNIDRRGMLEPGGGHFSPLGAYNEDSDSALFLDVARYKYPPAWVPLPLLFDAMNTTDGQSNLSRGVVVVRRSKNEDPTLPDAAGPAFSLEKIRDCLRANVHRDDESLDIFKQCWRNSDFHRPSRWLRWFTLLLVATVSAASASLLTYFFASRFAHRQGYNEI